MFKRFTAGVAVGYVLGARAGQKRYDQITELADRALDIPFVERLADSGRSMAMDQGRRMVAGIKDRAQWNGSEPAQGSNDAEDVEDDEVEAGYDDDDDRDRDDADEIDDADEVDDVQGDQDDDDHADVEDVDDDQFLDDEDAEEDEVDQVNQMDEVDDGGGAEPEEERPNGRSRRRIGALASAARDRGRVD